MTYKNYEELPLVLSVEQLVAVLDIGKTTAYELLRCGEIQSIRVGHKIKIPKEAIISYLRICQS